MTPLDLRGVRELCEKAKCVKCDGEGTRGYGDTTCGRGGAGGQTVTVGACRDCRGLGWSLAYLDTAAKSLPQLLALVEELSAARDAACDLAESIYDGSNARGFVTNYTDPLRAIGQRAEGASK